MSWEEGNCQENVEIINSISFKYIRYQIHVCCNLEIWSRITFPECGGWLWSLILVLWSRLNLLIEIFEVQIRSCAKGTSQNIWAVWTTSLTNNPITSLLVCKPRIIFALLYFTYHLLKMNSEHLSEYNTFTGVFLIFSPAEMSSDRNDTPNHTMPGVKMYAQSFQQTKKQTNTEWTSTVIRPI